MSLTFRYCRLEKILPQPGKSQGISSLLAAFLWGEWEDSCLLCLTPDSPQSPIAPVLPDSPEPNLGSVLIPGRVWSRLGLTPRTVGSKEVAKGLKSDTFQDIPALSVSAIRLPVQRLGHLQLCRGLGGPAEFQLHFSICCQCSCGTQRGKNSTRGGESRRCWRDLPLLRCVSDRGWRRLRDIRFTAGKRSSRRRALSLWAISPNQVLTLNGKKSQLPWQAVMLSASLGA